MMGAIAERTIQVSGYQPMAARTYPNGLTVAGSVHVAALLAEKIRCQGCHRYTLADRRLRLNCYCASCLLPWVEHCLERHRRLPDVGEFYCTPCGGIYPVTECCPPEGFWRRWRCRECRRKQMKAAYARFQARATERACYG